MSLLTCNKLRIAVAVSGSLFVLGFVLQAPRLMFGAEFPVLAALLSGVGLLAMVLSPVLMLATALLAAFPGISRRLELCNR